MARKANDSVALDFKRMNDVFSEVLRGAPDSEEIEKNREVKGMDRTEEREAAFVLKKLEG
jgi:hypothetical protein